MNKENQRNQQDTPQDECEQLQDLLPAYSMNMTDTEDTQLVERLLKTCPDVADEQSDYESIAEAMLFSVPQQPAPKHLANRLLEATATATAPTTTPIAPPIEQKSLWETAKSWLFVDPHPDSVSRRRLKPAWGGLALALIVVIVGVILVFFSQNDNANEPNEALITEFPEAEIFLASFGSAEVVRFDLSTPANATDVDANGTLLCNPERTQAYVHVTDFEPLPDGQTYQIWLVDGAERISVGTFMVNDYGNASYEFTAPMPMGEFQYLRITAEPYGGSEQPTTRSVVTTRLY